MSVISPRYFALIRTQLLPERSYSSSSSHHAIDRSQAETTSYRLPPIFPFGHSQPPLHPPSSENGQRPIDISSESLPVEASLRERLAVWRNAPGGRGEIEGEVELGGFNQWNLEVSQPMKRSSGSAETHVPAM